MTRVSNLTVQIELIVKKSESNRIPIVCCRIKSLNCRITPKKCSMRHLNPNCDWDLPITSTQYSTVSDKQSVKQVQATADVLNVLLVLEQARSHRRHCLIYQSMIF